MKALLTKMNYLYRLWKFRSISQCSSIKWFFVFTVATSFNNASNQFLYWLTTNFIPWSRIKTPGEGFFISHACSILFRSLSSDLTLVHFLFRCLFKSLQQQYSQRMCYLSSLSVSYLNDGVKKSGQPPTKFGRRMRQLSNPFVLFCFFLFCFVLFCNLNFGWG